MGTIILPQLGWHNRGEVEYPLPEQWRIETCNMTGFDRPALKSEAIQQLINSPIGTQRIRELAKGKRQVVILFDDMARITRTYDFIPQILEELAEAGITDENIRFVCATGCHGALTRIDFVKKLGKNVLERFPVYNHNPFGNCVFVGKTKTFGTDVFINEEVMKCDLKIAIGGVVPHPMSGFGGGGKIILPGVASFNTTRHNHHVALNELPMGTVGMGIFDENLARLDIEEAATLAGLDFIVNALFNQYGETVNAFAGALKPAYAAAIAESKKHYFTPPVHDKDMVITNAYIKANEAVTSLNIAYTAIGKSGGDIVLIANEPAGQVVHYLLGAFGCKSCGPEYKARKVPQKVNKIIIYQPHPDLASRIVFPVSDKVIFKQVWSDVLKILEEDYLGTANVAVFPNGEIQFTA